MDARDEAVGIAALCGKGLLVVGEMRRHFRGLGEGAHDVTAVLGVECRKPLARTLEGLAKEREGGGQGAAAARVHGAEGNL